MAPTVSDELLGTHVIAALEASRFLEPSHADFITVCNMERASRSYDVWVNQLLAEFGYRSRRELFRNMRSCGIDRYEGQVRFRPYNHEGLEVWSLKGIDEASYIVIPQVANPSAHGVALKECFKRCT